jgi:hypothetical protein
VLFKDITKSKKEITSLLQATFKSTTKGPQGLVFGDFKLEQVWQQIEYHTSKVNSKIMSKVSNMLTDETFLD